MCENEFSYASESFPGFPGTRPGCRNDLLSVGGYNLANFWGIVKFPLQGDNVQNGVGLPGCVGWLVMLMVEGVGLHADINLRESINVL